MKSWKGTLPWALVSGLAGVALVALGFVVLDPADQDAIWTPPPRPTPSATETWEDPEPEATEEPEDESTEGSEPVPPGRNVLRQGQRTQPRAGATTPPRPPLVPERQVPSGSPAASPVPSPEPYCVPVPSVTSVSLLSFNIHGGLHRRGAGLDLATIAEEIRAADADVVMLQEVDRFRARSGFVDTAEWLGERLGMDHVFGANVVRPPAGRGRGPSEYGVATLSRLPIVEAELLALPNAGGREQRGVLRTRLAVGADQVDVLNTHFEHTSPELRVQQAATLRGIVERSDVPVAAGGDYNAHRGSPPYATITQVLSDSWLRVGVGTGATVPATAPNGRIDYVFLDDSWVPESARVIPTAVSDHRGVVVRATLAGATKCRWVEGPNAIRSP